ncbi:MAG TPA: hypothetical protein VI861_00370 [Rickettsiales bacterium]|nr:hypothetical protein [Rickettsiales bacterium]
MQSIFKKTKRLNSIFMPFKEAILKIFEEGRTIIRNKKYSANYPVFFAIFSILEHEQSPHVFELNSDNFQIIKDEIFPHENINNGNILESLRGLFQNKFVANRSIVKIKIANYLFTKTHNLISNNHNNYYDPLIHAIFHGFPFLLNFNNYEIFRKIIAKKSKNYLRLIKSILDSHNFPYFLAKKEEIIYLILSSLKFNNKPAFMMFLRYLRQNNLIYLLFDNCHNLKSKILSLAFIQRRDMEYAASFISYCQNDFLKDKKNQKILNKFLEDIFSYRFGLKQDQRIEYYHILLTCLKLNQGAGYQNHHAQKILENVINRFIGDDARNSKRNKKFLKIHIKKLQKQKNSFVKIKEMLNISVNNKFCEEYWLLKSTPYLL